MSPVQMMLIQLQVDENFTRLGLGGVDWLATLVCAFQTLCVAWEGGYLEKSYLRRWLTDTSHELERLEQEATPPGWLCQWDRYSIPSKICVLFRTNKHESFHTEHRGMLYTSLFYESLIM